ncbi:MAG: HAMP domain-containing histidine kinase, partial [Firmicutes bacterium]|nr:HAMP domain-containing histidine kinase [Bacillota bacterium]
MKFGWKIFFLCMGIYIISLTVTGVVVTENTYNSLLKKEVARAVEEESNLHSTLLLYLRNNQRIVQEKVALRNYSRSIVDTVKNDGNYLEIYDDKLNLLATNAPRTWYYPRQELEVALQGQKNFVLRKDDEGFYLFVSNVLKLEEEKIVLSLIKNITHVENHRREQYLFFLRTGLIGLGFVAVITWLLSTLLLKPLRNLTLAAQKIASGDITVRTNIKRKDEVGILAAQFDLMADNIEQKITQLEEEGQRQQRFIDNLTHELRTPLTSIIGYADYLQKAAYDPEVLKKGLRYIYEEGKRLLNVSKTLTNMILIREKPLRREKAAVIPLLHEVKKIMHIKAQKNEIVLEVAGQDVTLNLDKELFKVALCNLVDNA